MGEHQQWPIVFRTHDQVEAEMIKGLLTTSGIPVIVEAKGFKSMATFFGNAAPGELVLKVPPDQEQIALDLLAADAEMEEQ